MWSKVVVGVVKVTDSKGQQGGRKGMGMGVCAQHRLGGNKEKYCSNRPSRLTTAT